jgi:hypothetical protein
MAVGVPLLFIIKNFGITGFRVETNLIYLEKIVLHFGIL